VPANDARAGRVGLCSDRNASGLCVFWLNQAGRPHLNPIDTFEIGMPESQLDKQGYSGGDSRELLIFTCVFLLLTKVEEALTTVIRGNTKFLY
jgi:hypothetical protein